MLSSKSIDIGQQLLPRNTDERVTDSACLSKKTRVEDMVNNLLSLDVGSQLGDACPALFLVVENRTAALSALLGYGTKK